MISQMSTQKSTEKTAITTTTCDQAALCIFFPQSFVFILVLFLVSLASAFAIET
jgi:hypothetical protein